jgi:hypothetical protein
MDPLQRLVIVGAVGSIETDPGRLDPIVNLVQADVPERLHACDAGVRVVRSSIERIFHER